MKLTLSKTYSTLPNKLKLLFWSVIALHFCVSIIFINKQSVNGDEVDYFNYAIKWAKGNPLRSQYKLNDSKSPIVALTLIPRVVKQLIHPNYKPTDFGINDIKLGRLFMYPFTALAAFIFFIWGFQLFNIKAVFICLLLLLFDPLFFSYGLLIGTDLISGALLITLAYIAWQYYRSNQCRYLAMLSVVLSIALVCKLTFLYVLPLLFGYFIILWLSKKTKLSKAITQLSIILIVIVIIINLVYYFHNSFFNLSNQNFNSTFFISLSRIEWINRIPIPLPFNYIESMDMAMHHAEIGGGDYKTTASSYWGILFNGQWIQKGNLWYYYFGTFLIKSPLLIVTIILFGIIISFRKKINTLNAFAIIPILYFTLILSFFNPFKIGIRHLLIIFPLLFFVLVPTIQFLLMKIKIKYLLFILLIHFFLLFRYFPFFISYTNELIWDKKIAYKYLHDSSIDYYQSQDILMRFLQKNKDYKTIVPEIPTPGNYILSVDELSPRNSQKKWLTQNFAPTAHLAYCYFIFNVTENQLIYLE
ncbi:MAG: glycosyltransferase family 39 protein [Ferruginibacter sp.]|nr:glycosyltransferase family 39 protein [Ferruginibacter sp.]